MCGIICFFFKDVNMLLLLLIFIYIKFEENIIQNFEKYDVALLL